MKYAEILHRCFRCGYCILPGNYMDFNCPAYAAFRFETYSPGGRMWLLRAWLDHRLQPSRRFQEILFSCTACGNCVAQCPLTKIKDELLLAFTAGKAELVDEGKVPPAVGDCLTKLQKYGNPYGISRKKRTDWAGDAEVEIFSDQLIWKSMLNSYSPASDPLLILKPNFFPRASICVFSARTVPVTVSIPRSFAIDRQRCNKAAPIPFPCHRSLTTTENSASFRFLPMMTRATPSIVSFNSDSGSATSAI